MSTQNRNARDYILIRCIEETEMNDFGLNKNDIARLIYLASYCDYVTGRLKFDNGKHIDKDDISKMLKLQPRQVKLLFDKLLSSRLFYKFEDDYYLNKDISKIGFVESLSDNEKYMKIHKKNFRKVFNESEQRTIPLLSIIYKSLPYIEPFSNVFIYKDDSINKTTLSELLGYANVTKMISSINKLKCNGQDIIKIHNKSNDKRSSYFTIINEIIIPASNKDNFNYNKYSHDRHIKLKKLKNDFSKKQEKQLLERFDYKCAFTNKDVKLNFDHVIPISWEVYGSTLKNMLPISKYINISKGNRNIFKWYKENKEKYKVDEVLFHNALTYISELNDMTLDEYTNFVYECEYNYRKQKSGGNK